MPEEASQEISAYQLPPLLPTRGSAPIVGFSLRKKLPTSNSRALAQRLYLEGDAGHKTVPSQFLKELSSFAIEHAEVQA